MNAITCEIVAGVFARRDVRAELERLRFHGHPVEWIEDKRWLESRFEIKGPVLVLRALKRAVDQFNEGVPG